MKHTHLLMLAGSRAVTLAPPGPPVIDQLGQWRSGANRSVSAVDPIPVGATMSRFAAREVTYRDECSVLPAEVPAFQGGSDGNDRPSFSATFVAPGTGHGSDSSEPGFTGMAVVQ
ncbi:MAG TPA: hypothetical protein PKA66_00135 [Gemmatimonadales bacterium]|nr:hypothetical protein [Gemmatimonadales bacterium]